MKYVTISELKKYLNSNNKELSIDIIDLFKKFDDVKKYYTNKINPKSEDELFNNSKKKIINEFYPERGQSKLRYSIINKVISDYKKISGNLINLIELYFCLIEQAINFTNDFGDIDDRFYIYIETNYEKVLELLKENNLINEFKQKNDFIYSISRNFGWGFSDNMETIYCKYYELS